MKMREKIKNNLKITCTDIDLNTITHIEFYVKQLKFFGCYTPVIISSNEMVVTIPFEDAKKLKQGEVELQFAFTDSEGNHDASDVVKTKVDDLLKEAGYDSI